jgi:hypothetical protein
MRAFPIMRWFASDRSDAALQAEFVSVLDSKLEEAGGAPPSQKMYLFPGLLVIPRWLVRKKEGLASWPLDTFCVTRLRRDAREDGAEPLRTKPLTAYDWRDALSGQSDWLSPALPQQRSPNRTDRW